MPHTKECPLSAEQLKEVAEQYGTPFQLYDEKQIRDNLADLLGAFREHFPTFQNFFAVKALPNPAILQVVLDAGCGLDCSSTAELYIADQLGVAPENVMYTSNYTSPTDLEIAFNQGVIMNLDDLSLVQSLATRVSGFPDLISFRFNPGLGNTDSETASNVLGGPSAKFGVPEEQIEDAYRQAKALGAKRFGIHMMTGSCVLGDDYWAETVSLIMGKMAELSNKLDIEFEFVNIGGGIGIPYRPSEDRVNYKQLAHRVQAVWNQKLREHNIASQPKLLMECGRCVTGPYGWLVAKCEVVKTAFDNKYCGLDACMANLMRPGMYGSYHHITVPGRSGKLQITKVVGTLCENNDWFSGGPDCGGKPQADQSLPCSAGVGDLFVIHDTGAHSHSMGFQYNGKLRAPELLLRATSRVEKPVIELIRSRETIQSLYANTFQLSDVPTPGEKQTGVSDSLACLGRQFWGVGAIMLTGIVLNVAVSYQRAKR